MEKKTILENGVYIVYNNGRYVKYEQGDNPEKQEGMQVGISWNGHTWIVGKDYGDLPWSEASYEELSNNEAGITKEYEALFDWDYMALREQLIDLWKHIPFKDNETMPTAPMVLVQEYLATHGDLNAALSFCGLPKYKTGTDRWFAERSNVNTARFFYGPSGLLGTGVNSRFRVQAVTLWQP